MTPDLLPLLAVALPLGLALLAPWLGRAVWPLYALAGLALVAAGLMPGGETALPGLLVGMSLAVEPGLGPVMAGSGAVWAAASLHARGSMVGIGAGTAAATGAGTGAGIAAPGPRVRVFACLFGLAMAGNALLLVAEDMVSFYVGYSVMSLSAWGLIAHRRTAASDLAARLYLGFAVAGELCLFAAVMLIEARTGSLLTPAALAVAPPETAVWLAIAAFGIKAGLVPLHMWLPLAHPAAPVPASAALSGAMLKAGVVGALKLAPPVLMVPEGGAAPAIETLGQTLLVLGLAGAFAGGLYGALSGERKTVLAYSSVSQLGMALALLGAGYAGHAQPGTVAAALALFALHHALAKGALFLAADSGMARAPTLAVFLLAGLALTGMPFTLGAASKAGFEAALAGGAPAPVDLVAVFALAAFATAAAMARAASLPWAAGPREPWRAGGVLALAAAIVLAALPGLVLPEADGLVKALAPGVALLAGAALLARLGRHGALVPAGDVAMLVPAFRAAPGGRGR